MDFKQLQSFNAVVQFQSFTVAAEKLQLSQPTVSTHVRMLEDELQTQLVIRTTKNIEITPKGRELYECAAQILNLRDRLLQNWSDETKKVIHLGASTIPSAYILPEVLPVFGEMFPDVYFIVNQSDSQGVIDAVENGAYDVGLIGMHCADEMLNCIPFYQDRMVLITPVNAHYLSLQAQGAKPEELILHEPVILRENGSGSQKSVDTFFESLGIEEGELHVTARMNDQESIKNLVAGGLGISIMSEKAAQNFYAEKRILKFDLPGYAAGRQLYIIYRKNTVLKPYVASLVQYVVQYYQSK